MNGKSIHLSYISKTGGDFLLMSNESAPLLVGYQDEAMNIFARRVLHPKVAEKSYTARNQKGVVTTMMVFMCDKSKFPSHPRDDPDSDRVLRM